MGVLQRFERRLEGAVGSTFARLFKGQVEPVEIAKALQREAEDKRAIVGTDRVLVPNRYVVMLGPADHDRLAEYESQLTNTLAEMVQEHVDDEGWSTFGDIEVGLERHEELGTGMFHVQSSVDPGAAPRRRPHNSLSMPVVPVASANPPYPPNPGYRGGPGRGREDDGYGGGPAANGYADGGYGGAPGAGYADGYGGAPGGGYAEQGYGSGGGQTGYADPGYGSGYGGYDQHGYQEGRVRHLLTVDGSQQWHELGMGSNVIGRGQDADLRLPDTGVSRRHVDVRYDGAIAILHDLGSTNGTTVNGHRAQTWQLQHGDVIRLGHTVLVYRQEPA